MIASTALELFVLGLAVWQLIVVRRSIRADRERAAAMKGGMSPPREGEERPALHS